jgi:hypothetical protein
MIIEKDIRNVAYLIIKHFDAAHALKFPVYEQVIEFKDFFIILNLN